MNKHRFFSLIGSIVFAALPLSGLSAAEPDLLFAENHNYSVVMRGNGESIVYAKIQLTNNGDAALSTYQFEIPRLKATEIVGFQAVLPQTCIRYEDYNQKFTAAIPDRKCLQYRESSYGYDSNYIPENSEFLKVKIGSPSSGKQQITLPKPIEVGKSSFLVLSYVGKGYVTQALGVSTFNFETLKVPSRIKTVTVAVDVDSDLILEGKRSKVNYSSGSKSAISQGASLDAASNSSLRNFADTIGTSGPIIKEAKNLSAGETLTVKGRYAESAWQLNLWKIAITVFVLLAIVVALFLLIRRYRRKHPEATGSKVPIQEAESRTPAATTSVAPALAAAPIVTHTTHLSLINPLYILGGFASAALVMIATIGLSIYINSAQDSYSSPDPLSMIIISILVIIFYVLSVLGPAMWMASAKRDWRILIYVIVWEFAWLLLFMVIYQFGYKELFTPADQPRASDVLLD